MFTDSFWTPENEIAYQATTGRPSPVALRNAATMSDDDIILDAFDTPAAGPAPIDNSSDDDFELNPVPYLLEKREFIAEAIPTARGRELATLIRGMDRINAELRECGYFPAGV